MRNKTNTDFCKERLQNILLRERIDIGEDTMMSLKQDILDTVREYFIIDEKNGQIYLSESKKEGKKETILVSFIPLHKRITS